jgi:hypothetical protein
MKLSRVAALALFAASAAPAFASSFVVDFETNWAYGSLVNSYYSGGSADDGTSGANLGVEFVNVGGLSNDAGFTYYSGAPSPKGTAFASTFLPDDRAYMNVAGGVNGGLSFYYSSPVDLAGAVKAYSGLNGTGTLLGTFDLRANSSSYDTWNAVTFQFGGLAHSFDLTGAANVAGFDNISAVPEPGMLAMLLAGGLGLALRSRRRA